MTTDAPVSASRRQTRDAYQRVVERVIRSMHDHIDQEMTLQDMADVAYFSPYHFNRVFRAVTGVPPVRFLYALRLARAKGLLLTTDLSVTDVCFEVGYNSLGTFSSRFASLVGVPPSQFLQFKDVAPPALPAVSAASAGDGASGDGMPGDVPEPVLDRRSPALVSRPSSRPASDDTRGNVRSDTPDAALHGRVILPDGFRGSVVVGLFPDPIPQGQPAACTIVRPSGAFAVDALPKTPHFVVALAVPRPDDAHAFLVPDPSDVLVGVGDAPVSARFDDASDDVDVPTVESVELVLRPVRLTDPPILTALTPLMTSDASDAR